LFINVYKVKLQAEDGVNLFLRKIRYANPFKRDKE
jgi:hypothetical protein